MPLTRTLLGNRENRTVLTLNFGGKLKNTRDNQRRCSDIGNAYLLVMQPGQKQSFHDGGEFEVERTREGSDPKKKPAPLHQRHNLDRAQPSEATLESNDITVTRFNFAITPQSCNMCSH
jgi:hypothetical protein